MNSSTFFDGVASDAPFDGGWTRGPTRSSVPSCSRPSRTLRAADAVARRRAILDRHCARRHGRARVGTEGLPVEQKDGELALAAPLGHARGHRVLIASPIRR